MCELPSVYSNDRRKARKAHKCIECRGAIPVGEPYHNHHGVWDHRGATYKVCCDCEALRDEIDKAAGTINSEDQTGFGELYEAVFDNHNAPQWIGRFMIIQRKRHSIIPKWMVEREQGLLKTDV